MTDRKVLLTDTKIKEIVDRINHWEVKEFGEHAIIRKLEDFTCHQCEDKYRCVSSFDLYNTGGDCLESK